MTLIIRNEQMSAFQNALERRFVLDIAVSLRGRYPSLFASIEDRDLEKLVWAAVERANLVGLKEDCAVSLFATLIVAVGWHFDLYPPFHDILYGEYSNFSAESQLNKLVNTAEGADWVLAAKLSDQFLTLLNIQHAAAAISATTNPAKPQATEP
jgi:hypothetical protein